MATTGQASIGITLNIDSHAVPVMLEDAADQVAALARASRVTS